jgi:hypothetical protein
MTLHKMSTLKAARWWCETFVKLRVCMCFLPVKKQTLDVRIRTLLMWQFFRRKENKTICCICSRLSYLEVQLDSSTLFCLINSIEPAKFAHKKTVRRFWISGDDSGFLARMSRRSLTESEVSSQSPNGSN